MSRKARYEADPALIERPLRADEVRDIISARGKGFINKPDKVMHFVERALVTLDEARRQRINYEARLEETTQQLRELQVSGGVGGILDPELVLPYMDPVVLAKHAGGAARELAERADRQSQAAEGALARAWRQLTALAERFDNETRAAILAVRDNLLMDGYNEPRLTESELYAAAAAQAQGQLAPDRILNAEELNRLEAEQAALGAAGEPAPDADGETGEDDSMGGDPIDSLDLGVLADRNADGGTGEPGSGDGDLSALLDD